MDVYFLSGLGADARVFVRLRLAPAHVVHHVPWIPWEAGESLPKYAQRLSTTIDTTSPFALAGLSLGGMLAAEMSRFLQPSATLLLSSAPSALHLPPWFRTPGLPALQRLLPAAIFRFDNSLLHWLFGLKTAEEKALFRSIVRDADPRFVKRAVQGVLTWNSLERPPGLHTAHGRSDRLLPVRFARPDTLLPGGHLSVFTHAEAVSGWINGQLGSI